MASKNADRKFCVDLLKVCDSDRSKFAESLKNELQCELPLDKVDNVFRDSCRTKDKLRLKKKVDLDKILIETGEGIRLDNIENLKDISNDIEYVSFSFPTPSKKRKHITECKRHSLYQRTDDLFNALKLTAETENISPSRLAARILARCIWDDSHISQVDQRHIFEICDNYFATGDIQHKKIPIPVALTIISDCDLGRQKYNLLRKYIDSGLEKGVMPAWDDVNSHIKSITPEVIKLDDPFDGYSFPLYDSVSITLTQLLKNASININDHESLCFKLKAGLDGSGNHKIFNQMSSTDTNNMILTVFAPLNIQNTQTNEIIWSCENPNSANVHRPLILQTGKETQDNLMTCRELSEKMRQLEATGLCPPGQEKTVEINITMSCFDRKAADTLQGTGGSFCDLCVFSDKQCQQSVNLENMTVTRNVDSAQNIFNLLSDDDGNIQKKVGDYSTRLGVTQEPILRKNILSAQPLHARLRGLDFYVKLITHLRAGLDPSNENFWSESKGRADLVFIKKAKEERLE